MVLLNIRYYAFNARFQLLVELAAGEDRNNDGEVENISDKPIY